TTPFSLHIVAGDRIEIDAESATIAPRCGIAVRIVRAQGLVEHISATGAIETQLEVELLRAGGVIPSTLARMMRGHDEDAASAPTR
ncbi:MAG: hypothetical protein ABIO63_05200, partial [Casimicrobiaceae bacterium]